MMKRFLLSCSLATALVGAGFVAAQEKPKTPPVAPATKAPPAKTPAGTAPTAAPKRSAEDEALAQTVQALVKSYQARDAKAFAAVFTAEGEYLDETGAIFHGRKAIEEEFGGFLKEHPGTTIDVEVGPARLIAPGVLAADGVTRLTQTKGEPAVPGHCALVCTKEGTRWLIASLRETAAAAGQPSAHEELKQLEWLVGEWLDETPGSRVHFSCRWDESGAFLLRDFAVQSLGERILTGTERIGYDPLTSRLKSWVFDSSGGYADGYWHREGNSWILNSAGVTSDGRIASGSSIFAPVDAHRYTFHSVDRIVGGDRLPDLTQVTVVRKPPAPSAAKK
jgi:uncharacterized protein (TIGR02246 family)